MGIDLSRITWNLTFCL